MPRCYTTKKINAQQQPNRQNVATVSKSKTNATVTNRHNNNNNNISNRRNGSNGEWKTPTISSAHQKFPQRKSLAEKQNTNKDVTTCPVSPTEGSVAPIYYNNTHETNTGEYAYNISATQYNAHTHIYSKIRGTSYI